MLASDSAADIGCQPGGGRYFRQPPPSGTGISRRLCTVARLTYTYVPSVDNPFILDAFFDLKSSGSNGRKLSLMELNVWTSPSRSFIVTKSLVC